MQIEPLGLDGPLLITPVRHGDARGFFSEVFRGDLLASHGVEATFVQDNHAASAQRGVVRGLHYQLPPSEQGKLVRCTRGAVLDVVVDIRAGSPSFGRHLSTELSALNWRQIWVPSGFAHGYVTLTEDTEVLYKATSYYDPAAERGIAWDDPTLAIDWRVPVSEVILSAKDRSNPWLADADVTFTYGAVPR
ncbi:MAG TPA: dTDP-4-dehydrorhamnose 3,5-epimerase [Caulobacteraceae bacterium]|nr:dTDP-4-dehydrorhamnose 3,5-epimerase [Caulobacteraceae bacterium]